MEQTTTIADLRKTNDSILGSLRLRDDLSSWSETVHKVVVILSASRSGSSLLYQAMVNSGNVIAPAGEHEPWLFLSENKFPFTESDEQTSIANKQLLLKLLRNDLLVREDIVPGSELIDLIWNRLTIRRENAQRLKLEKIKNSYIHKKLSLSDGEEIAKIIGINIPFRGDMDNFLPIENPPYIDQPHARRATLEEFTSKTLVFKSPSDAYRPGFYESLFPNAEIKYIHLTRGFAQTVNGLMDGWSQNEIDFISNPIGIYGQNLAISDYSTSAITKRYWCFDLFPGWREYEHASLVEICAQQWLQAHAAILNNFSPTERIAFESFYSKRGSFFDQIRSASGIDITSFNWNNTVMSTEKPTEFRWRKREQVFQNLNKHLKQEAVDAVSAMQQKLGYSMEESTWH